MQCVKDRGHHGDWAEPRVIEHLVVDFFGGGAIVDIQRHRNHFGLLVQNAHDSRVTILHKCARRLGRVDDLERVQRRWQRGQNVGLGHGQIDAPELQQGVTAGQQTLGIDVGHGAGRGDIHIATHENSTHGRSRFERFGLFLIAGRPGAHDGNNPVGRKLGREELYCLFTETIEHQRRLNGL